MRATKMPGTSSDARIAFEKILALDPKNARAENNLGLILETEGNPEAAMEAYRKAIAWQEDGSASEQPYVNLGNLLVEQGHAQDALKALEKAVALAPNDAYCHMTLGVLYRKAGDTERAKRELLRATELDPNNPKTHYQLGRLYKDLHELDRAKAEFDRTAELQSRGAGGNRAAAKP
jgi:Flp pilus assembly protein TadD